jgi:hypothetical protein
MPAMADATTSKSIPPIRTRLLIFALRFARIE